MGIDIVKLSEYFMESEDETFRLDIKTDPAAVRRQAIWAGLKPGMRVLDAGCGSGKTTSILHEFVQPKGMVIGVDFSPSRVQYAKEHYEKEGIAFLERDIREPLDDLGLFDLIWIRFVLEYYKTGALDIVKNLSNILKPGGTLCLIDLDHNCLNYYGISERLENAIKHIIKILMDEFNFDPYAGRKLYSYLYDIGYENIQLHMEPHHLIYGPMRDSDSYNWTMKLVKVIQKLGLELPDYYSGCDEFLMEAQQFLADPRRFIYTPVILAKGTKPLSCST